MDKSTVICLINDLIKETDNFSILTTGDSYIWNIEDLLEELEEIKDEVLKI